MKKFNEKLVSFFYFCYRLINTLFDPFKLVRGLYGWVWYIADIIQYKIYDRRAKLFNIHLYPILNERVAYTPFDAHYFFQEVWTFEHVLRAKPRHHVDVASKYQLAGFLSKIVKTTFVDLRPIDVRLKNLEAIKGDILNLPYKSNTVESLSCLHVVEHIGLGRYGDPIDPEGSKKACKELARVLAKDGFLYFSVPIGKSRICFNAHRVHSPELIIEYFKPLKLVTFSVVDDAGKLHEKVDYQAYKQLDYGCGLFVFTKKNAS